MVNVRTYQFNHCINSYYKREANKTSWCPNFLYNFNISKKNTTTSNIGVSIISLHDTLNAYNLHIFMYIYIGKNAHWDIYATPPPL